MISSAASSNMSSCFSYSSRSLTFLSSSFLSRRAFRASISPLFLLMVSVRPLIAARCFLTFSRCPRILSSIDWPSALSLNSMYACCLSIASRFCLTSGSASFSSSFCSSPSPASDRIFSDLSSLASSFSAASLAAASSFSFSFCSCSF